MARPTPPTELQVITNFAGMLINIVEPDDTHKALAIERFEQQGPKTNMEVLYAVVSMLWMNKDISERLKVIFDTIYTTGYALDDSDMEFAIVHKPFHEQYTNVPQIMVDVVHHIGEELASKLMRGEIIQGASIEKAKAGREIIFSRRGRLMEWMNANPKNYVIKLFRYLMYFCESLHVYTRPKQ